MKVKRLELGEERETVVVGVKLEQQSRELLTWALVNVAKTEDRVIALHVLHNAELLDRNGNSALLSLVKAFESILGVYEGFCNLKQIDLKLKICRGPSVQKVLANEAKSFNATKVVLGIKQNNHFIRSSALIARYCAKKLPPQCCVLAASNGKVVFKREATNLMASTEPGMMVNNHQHHTRFLTSLRWTLSKNFKVPKRANARNLLTWEDRNEKNSNAFKGHRHSRVGSAHAVPSCSAIALHSSYKATIKNCSICNMSSTPNKDLPSIQSIREPSDDYGLVPVLTPEVASSSGSHLMHESPKLRSGWPLLRRAFLPTQQLLENSKWKKISVFRGAIRLPLQQSVAAVHPDNKMGNQVVLNLDGESGAIVPVGDVVSPSSDANESKIQPEKLEALYEKYSSTCRLFTYKELLLATSNFSIDNIIGKGGNSQVYRGCLPDGKELAVKILNPSGDAVENFALEIEIISTLNHKNIVSLIGFCFEENKLLLVYDFIPRGSLEENLRDKSSETILSWEKRYKVAVCVAEALDYLHSSVEPVIHRDVKSSNILLADDFEPQLSDFGLATWASASSSHLTCNDMAGTFGYLAPEYFMYGKVNDKLDVYAFGVVLLELLSGRKPINNEYPKGQESLVLWAKAMLECGKFTQLLDPNFGNEYKSDQVEKMAMAASLCTRRLPRLRPQMSHILKLLQGDGEVVKWARSQFSELEESKELDDEEYPPPDIQSYLNLAFLKMDEDSLSVRSTEPSFGDLTADKSLEDYLQGRWSRTSSFD